MSTKEGIGYTLKLSTKIGIGYTLVICDVTLW